MARTSINRVMLTANLVEDGVYTEGNVNRLNLRVAYNNYSAKAENNSKPGFIDVTLFGGLAPHIADDCRKGRRITVEGRLDESTWTNDQGENRRKTAIIADNVEVHRGPVANGNGNGHSSSEEAPVAEKPTEKKDEVPF